jgi:hypothetical protein
MELYITFINSLKTYTHIFYKNMLFRYINKPNYLEFIYLKGLFLLRNIFLMLVINGSTNMTITILLEKAHIYFIEFLIQININCASFDLKLRDAVMFTYKKTILSYKQTNNNNNNTIKELDNNSNILCNIFYIVNNLNFIECLKGDRDQDRDQDEDSNIICCNKFITNKLNAIKTLENKLLKIMAASNNTNAIDNDSNDPLLIDLNNKVLELRTTMEKTIETHVKDANYNINMLNNIHTLLNTY